MDGTEFNADILERAKKHYKIKMGIDNQYYNLEDCIEIFWKDYFSSSKLFA